MLSLDIPKRLVLKAPRLMMQPPRTDLIIPIDSFPGSLNEFLARHPSKRAYHQLVWSARWPNGFQCHRCGDHRFYETRDQRGRPLYVCRLCKLKASLTTASVMASAKVPPPVWCPAAYLYSIHREDLGTTWLRKQLEISGDHTAIDLLQRFRQAISLHFQHPLDGVVETAQTRFFVESRKSVPLYIQGSLKQDEGHSRGELRLALLNEPSPHEATQTSLRWTSIFSDLEHALSGLNVPANEQDETSYWNHALQAYAFGHNGDWAPAVLFDRLLRALVSPKLSKNFN